jgi:glyoxylase-like metal-dependent hydrolase (beta-lactamase superfamily II)
MVIEKLKLGELQTNCYLMYDPSTSEAIVIDPADEASFIGEKLVRRNLELKFIIATHGHFDHILAAWELQLAFGIPFLIYKGDLFLVQSVKKSASWWLKKEIITNPPEKIAFIKDGEKINLGNLNISVIHTPGHTPGSVCLYAASEKILFTGDTLFAQGVGRTDFAYASEKQLSASFKKLSRLPGDTLIYPGHGESSLLGEALQDIATFA